MAATIDALRKEQQKIDRQIVDYSIKLLSPFYAKRRTIVKEIPRFWSIVVGETEPLRQYITFDDSLAFDTLEDLWVEWDPVDTRNFTISFTFGDNPYFEAQTLTKTLIWIGVADADENVEDTEGYYESTEPTNVKWKGDGSKLVRQHLNGGEESFFTWFEYTKTDNKEDRQENTVIAQLLVDEIFPTAIDLYKASQDESDIAEEFDISESD